MIEITTIYLISTVSVELSFSMKNQKDHPCIYILLNMYLRFAQFIHHSHYIPFVDKRAKRVAKFCSGRVM